MFLRPWEKIRTGFKYYKYLSTQKAEISISDAIVLSDSCVQKLKQLCDSNSFLRLCVESGGCSGFQYKFDLDDKIADDDKLVDIDIFIVCLLLMFDSKRIHFAMYSVIYEHLDTGINYNSIVIIFKDII